MRSSCPPTRLQCAHTDLQGYSNPPRTVQLRQKFVKPTASQILLVRTQHYQGEEHPAARKAVLSFSAADIPLASPAEHHKFRLIAGSRWDSDADTIKISCELFPTVKMNEKWCSDVLDKMVSEARVCWFLIARL